MKQFLFSEKGHEIVSGFMKKRSLEQVRNNIRGAMGLPRTRYADSPNSKTKKVAPVVL